MSTMKIINTMILINLTLFLSSCATGSKESILPQEGPTMKEVYEGHFNGTPASKVNDKSKDSLSVSKIRSDYENKSPDLTGYTRQAENEIQQIFPRLRNKTLVMYIFPHLSKGERHPVPGYSTAFTFYRQTEYALPGELSEGY